MLRVGIAQAMTPAGVLRLALTVLIEDSPSCDHICFLDEYLRGGQFPQLCGGKNAHFWYFLAMSRFAQLMYSRRH